MPSLTLGPSPLTGVGRPSGMGEATCWTLTAAGFLLRFYRLGFHSVWLDEVVTVRDAGHSLREIPSVLVSYPPLWAYITHGVYRLCGPSDFWLRAPSALAGTISVPVIWYAGKKFYGERAAFWAGLLMAVSALDVLYSQEIRMYALVALEALLSMAFWTGAVETGERRHWTAYSVMTLAGLYTHNWFPFLVLSQGVWFVGMAVRAGSLDRKGVAAFITLAAFYVPWLFILKKQIALPVYGHLHAPGWLDIRETFYALAGIRVPSGDSSVGVTYDAMNPLLYLSLGLLGWGLLFNDGNRPRAIRTFLVGCLLPISTAFIISVLAKPIYLPGRYPILGLPAYLLTVGRGFQGIPARWRWGKALLGGVWVTFGLYTLGHYYWFYEKSPWKETCQWVLRHSRGAKTLHLDLRASYGDYFTEYYLASRKINLDLSGERVKNDPIYLIVEDSERQKYMVFPPRIVTDIAHYGRLTVYKTQKTPR